MTVKIGAILLTMAILAGCAEPIQPVFRVGTLGDDGNWKWRDSNVVQLTPNRAAYAVLADMRSNSRRNEEIPVKMTVTLPAPAKSYPRGSLVSPDGRTVSLNRSIKPQDGILAMPLEVLEGDPPGQWNVTVAIDEAPPQTFPFVMRVRQPEDDAFDALTAHLKDTIETRNIAQGIVRLSFNDCTLMSELDTEGDGDGLFRETIPLNDIDYQKLLNWKPTSLNPTAVTLRTKGLKNTIRRDIVYRSGKIIGGPGYGGEFVGTSTASFAAGANYVFMVNESNFALDDEGLASEVARNFAAVVKYCATK